MVVVPSNDVARNHFLAFGLLSYLPAFPAFTSEALRRRRIGADAYDTFRITLERTYEIYLLNEISDNTYLIPRKVSTVYLHSRQVQRRKDVT